MINRERPPVQSVGEQDVGSEQIFQRQGSARTILTPHSHKGGAIVRLCLRAKNVREEIGEPHPLPTERPHAPRGDAMKIADLLDSRESVERVGKAHDVRHPSGDLQRRRHRVARKPAGEVRESEAMEDFDRLLTAGK